jgi:hypothetical protein
MPNSSVEGTQIDPSLLIYKPLPFNPIIIVGAGRSGTNVLRDTLTSIKGFETWDCDEINPIWRHGNLFWPDDEIPVSRVTPKIANFVRNQFVRLWKSRGCPEFIVEKTCANSLRVPFVSAIFPEAHFIYLVRNGYDVAASAEKRWRGEFELPKFRYILSKARYTPVCDLPFYSFRYLQTRLKLITGRSSSLSVWGPRFKGMSEMVDVPVIDFAALQWIHCIKRSEEAFENMEKDKLSEISYEELLDRPFQTIKRVLEDVVPSGAVKDSDVERAISCIRSSSGNKRHFIASRLNASVEERVRKIVLRKGCG